MILGYMRPKGKKFYAGDFRVGESFSRCGNGNTAKIVKDVDENHVRVCIMDGLDPGYFLFHKRAEVYACTPDDAKRVHRRIRLREKNSQK